MFSPNPYTRRRQQLTASLAAISGVAMVLLLLRGMPLSPPAAGALPTAPQARPDLASFGRVALAPGGEYQVELVGRQVRLREVATQSLMAVQEVPNAQALRFSPDGKEILVHVLRLQSTKLTDDIVRLDGLTGTRLSK